MAHDLSVLILIEHVERRPNGPAQDGGVLCPRARLRNSRSKSSRAEHSRGMIVSLLLRSVRPICEISSPSTRMHPSVASTKRKKDSASVLFPDPVRPRIPTWQTPPEKTSSALKKMTKPTFSPGRIEKLRLCSTFGRSGCVQSESREPTLVSDENAHRVSDDEPFAVDFSLGRPRSGRARLDELGWLALQLGILLHPFERHLRPSGGRQWPTLRRWRDELTIDCSKLTNRRTKKRICKSFNQSR